MNLCVVQTFDAGKLISLLLEIWSESLVFWEIVGGLVCVGIPDDLLHYLVDWARLIRLRLRILRFTSTAVILQVLNQSHRFLLTHLFHRFKVSLLLTSLALFKSLNCSRYRIVILTGWQLRLLWFYLKCCRGGGGFLLCSLNVDRFYEG